MEKKKNRFPDFTKDGLIIDYTSIKDYSFPVKDGKKTIDYSSQINFITKLVYIICKGSNKERGYKIIEEEVHEYMKFIDTRILHRENKDLWKQLFISVYMLACKNVYTGRTVLKSLLSFKGGFARVPFKEFNELCDSCPSFKDCYGNVFAKRKPVSEEKKTE